jgi:succinate dehydrogenase / fumarate reductase cytochrome b subunit
MQARPAGDGTNLPIPEMKFLKAYFTSSIGKKQMVAVTGLLLILFVVGHMVGNLQIFLAPEWINSYAYKLQGLGIGLWAIRIGLLAAVVIHIVAAISLNLENRKAGGSRYAVNAPRASTPASRSMVLSGLILLSFIVFHLLHFTVRRVPHHEYEEAIVTAQGEALPTHVTLTKHWGLKLSEMPPVEVHNVHGMMIAGFSYWYISTFYIFSMFLLALHLSHGVGSLFQTLGLRNSRNARVIDLGSRIFAWALFAGYISIPVAVMARIIKLES